MKPPLTLDGRAAGAFRRAVLRWYDRNRRDLPWRRDRDPYRVWVSEIMLQQTRVAAVLEHYARFLRRYPTVQALARARESSVLALWSGLGYYHRARRMHQAAKLIAHQRRGSFPTTAEEWRQLPGIGRYTAAAIASIAFGEPVAVVDGNVERVLQRLWGDRGKRRALARRNGGLVDAALAAARGEALWREAEALLDRKRPGEFNQAMMELGATICTPRLPQCLLCPAHRFCETRGELSAAQAALRKSRELAYGLARQNGSVLLVRRPADAGLMAGMWELPLIAADAMNGGAPLLRLRHSITDTDYRVAVFEVTPEARPVFASDARWFTSRQCERLPLTGLARKILQRITWS